MSYLIGKEIESLLRDSVEAQIDYITKRFKIDLSLINRHFEEFYELFQRRNLFVHNNGVVNRIYLSKAPASIIASEKATEGRPIYISQRYLDKSIDITQLVGTVLLQQCWVKWKKEDRIDVEVSTLESVYEALIDERYELAASLAEVVTGLQLPSDELARMNAINYSIALKQLGRTEELEKVLSKFDWSACALKFRIALAALRNQTNLLMETIPRGILSLEIDKEALLEWPLFKEFRSDPGFADLFMKLEESKTLTKPLQ